MKYFFVLLFITGCAGLQKDVNRDKHEFNKKHSASIEARKILSNFVNNPKSFVDWNADSPMWASKTITENKNTFEILCNENDEDACEELKFGEEAINNYNIKVAEIKKSETEANEEKKKLEIEQYKAEQLKMDEMAKRSKLNGNGEIQSICNTMLAIRISEDAIQREREIGKEVGVVNQKTLYEAGDRLRAARPFLKKAISEFNRKTGKKFESSMCSNRDEH